MAQTLSARRCPLAVFCGGFFGTLTRYLLSLAIQNWLGKVGLTISCSSILPVRSCRISDHTGRRHLSGRANSRLILNTGFLGAYTTFSSLALGDILLFSKGAWISACLYLTLSICGGLGAVLAGDGLGQTFMQRFRHGSKSFQVELERQESAIHLDAQDEILLSE